MKVIKHTPEPVEPTFSIEGLTQEQMDYLVACAYHVGTEDNHSLSGDIHTELLAGGGHAAVFDVANGERAADILWLRKNS